MLILSKFVYTMSLTFLNEKCAIRKKLKPPKELLCNVKIWVEKGLLNS